MAVIKTLSHLSLSRPSSQASAARNTSNPNSATTTLVQTTPPTPSTDYYLPDEDLTVHDQPRRSRSHGGTSRKADGASAAPSALTSQGLPMPAPAPAPGNVAKARRTLSLGPSLSMGGKARSSGHTTATTSMTNANGASSPSIGPHSGANGPLLAGLLSANSKGSQSAGNAPVMDTANSSAKVSSTPVAGPATPFEAGYVSKIGQRFRDIVNRIFPAAPENGLAWKGRGAPRVAVATEFAELIRGEILLAQSDQYILRSLLRTAVVPALTVCQSRLDVLLIAPTQEPSTLTVPKTIREVENGLPLALRYNIEVVKAAWLVRDAIETVAPPHDADARDPSDCLHPFAGKLDAIIQRLMGPYLAIAKSQLMIKIAQLRDPEPAPSPPATTKGLPIALTRSNPPVATPAMVHLPAGTRDRLRELAVSLDVLRKLFLVKLACGGESSKWMVSVASQAVWKGMLAFSARSVAVTAAGHGQQVKTPPSPPGGRASGVTRGLLRGGQRSPSPPHAHANGRRAKSPPHRHGQHSSRKDLLIELATFSLIIRKFVDGIAGLPEPTKIGSAECMDGAGCEFCSHGLSVKLEDDGDLVRDAMNEALEALSASELALRAVAHPQQLVPALLPGPPPPAPLTVSGVFALGLEPSTSEHIDHHTPPCCPTLDRALDELPPLILLHALAAGLSRSCGFRLPHEVWGEEWEEYESKLKGFVAAEQWTGSVAAQMRKEAEICASRVETDGGEKVNALDGEILKVIGLIGDAMAGTGA